MIGSLHKTEIWMKDFSGKSSPKKNALLTLFEEKKIGVTNWSNHLKTELGLIIAGTECLKELISFLDVSGAGINNRIVVVNIEEACFSTTQILKLFDNGVEYVYQFDHLVNNLECIVEKIERWRTIDSLLTSPLVTSHIAGSSIALKKLLRGIIEVAVLSQAPVIITGERGTGKESIARLIHEMDTRKQKDKLVVVDCSTLKKELSGSELFGHEKGAFTSADNSREGAFALAHNGTLFLDEIGELPTTLQAEFLRVMQEGTYKKLGSNVWKYTSFRLVAATNLNLKKETENGNFRKDLYDRIFVYPCAMPTLNDRKEDIPELVNFFLRQHFNGNLPCIDKAVCDYLRCRNYEGNIRELKNIIARMILRYIGKGPLTMGDIAAIDRPAIVEKEKKWYESEVFIDTLKKAIEDGYDMKHIDNTVKNVTMKIALSSLGKNKRVSEVLGVSDRWVQQRRAKENSNGK